MILRLISMIYNRIKHLWIYSHRKPDIKDLPYSQRSSAGFINDLEFDHIKTYSFRRGEEYEQFLKGMEKEYDRLVRRRNPTLDEVNSSNDLREQLYYTQNLIGKNGTLHSFSKHTGTFKSDSEEVSRIKEILRTEIVDDAAWMCAPSYRDAIVFYDKDDWMISCLDICLSCGHMEAKPFGQLRADLLTYDLLKKFFLEIGHEVEEAEHVYVSDKMKEQRERKNKSHG